MKRSSVIYIYIILFISLTLPTNIKAELVNYNEGINQANSYILNNDYINRNRYIQFNIPYEYNESGLVKNPSFSSGGMVSKREYEISIREGKSYLSPGIEYWTLSGKEGDVSKRYYIDTNIKEKNSTETSGVRVTEYVKNGVKIKGEGTYNNPYSFFDTYLVKIGSNSIKYGKVYDIGENIEEVSGEGIEKSAVLEGNDYVVDFNMKAAFGYKYESNNGCGNVIKIGTGEQYRINHIEKDISCIINFNARTIKFKLVSGIENLTTEPSSKEIYLRYADKWYKDANKTTSITSISPPSKLGYEFLGYYYKNDKLALYTEILNDTEEISNKSKWRDSINIK